MSRRGELPELPHDFNHAIFESVVFGPRRELTLKLNPPVWIVIAGIMRPQSQYALAALSILRK